MKHKRIMVVILIFLLVLSGYVAYVATSFQTAQIERSFSGYLMCCACAGAKGGMAADGINVLTNPEKHTVQCLRMPSCAASGFGMMIKNQKGNFTFYRFDARGSDLAYQNIIGKTLKVDNLFVVVTGKFQKGLISIDNIMEK